MLPEFSNIEAIKKLIPAFGHAQNPIDVTAEIIAKPEMFKKVLETIIEEQGIDGVIVQLTTNADPGASVIAKAILDVFQHHNKPIVVGRIGANNIAAKAMSIYQEASMPVYSTPERVVAVMKSLVEYSRFLRRQNSGGLSL